MNKNTLELRQRRAGIVEQMQNLSRTLEAEKRGMSADERSSYEKMKEESASLRESIAVIEEADELRREQEGFNDQQRRAEREEQLRHADGDRVITFDDYDLAMRAQMITLASPHMVTNEMREAAEKVNYDLSANGGRHLMQFRKRLMSKRQHDEILDGMHYRATTAQSLGTPAKGGFTADSVLSDRIEVQLKQFGSVRRACEDAGSVIRTQDGNAINYPTIDDTTNTGAILAENAGASVDDMDFAQKSLTCFKYTSNVVKASIELLQDTSYDLVRIIGDALGVRVGRKLNVDFTNGTTATTAPRGVVTTAPVGVTATTANTNVSFHNISKLRRAVDPAYRGRRGTGFMMSDGMVGEYERLVDSNGNPIFRPGNAIGAPDTILNEIVYINQDMVASSTDFGSKGVLYGWFGAYIVRDAMTLELYRLDERFATAGQVAWFTFSRHGGREIFASTANAPIQALQFTTA